MTWSDVKDYADHAVEFVIDRWAPSPYDLLASLVLARGNRDDVDTGDRATGARDAPFHEASSI